MYTKDFSDVEKKEIRDATKISDMHLKVSEIFVTIQGEGPNTGIPVVFVRLALCNLHCKFCDTPYTFNWEGTNFNLDTKDYEQVKYDPRKEIVKMTPHAIYSKVQELAGYTVNRVILTGGEPLVQQRSRALLETLDYFVNNLAMHVEIETNGTIIPTEEVQQYIDQFNVSPKLGNSGNGLTSRRRDKAYEFYADYPQAFFKFVVTGNDDIKEIEELQCKYNICPSKILLMPEGRTDKETRSRAQDLVKICIKKGYRFCNRLQVWVWDGALRGV